MRRIAAFVLVFMAVSRTWAVEPVREFTNSIGITLTLISSGEFLMGAPPSDTAALADELPQHTVRITKAFYLATKEVTQEQYERIMGNNPSFFKGDSRPVERVSWQDAVAFCKKLSAIEGRSYRLPTEAEWEYACRAASSTRFAFGDDDVKLREYAWCATNSGKTTHQVGTRKPNAWGLFDMHGNVMEWCSDVWDERYYATSPVDDPQGAASQFIRVSRGGAWNFPYARCRSTSRYWFPPTFHTRSLGMLGFRVAVELQE